MKKSMLVFAMSLMVVNFAAAEASDARSAVDSSRFSVQAGLGFFAEDNFDGFLLNLEGNYHIDESWSAGVDLQLGFDNDFLLLSMPFYGRYDFGNLAADAPFLSKMHPFAKLGLGFTYAEIDTSFFDIDDTGFLFVMGGGVAYEINDNLSAETTMQFNITTNDFFADDFYFSWEIISLRYRF